MHPAYSTVRRSERSRVAPPSKRAGWPLLLVPALLTLVSAGSASTPHQIHIVGSSTAFPYVNAVAQSFAARGFPQPVVESTGTDNGVRMFCEGMDANYPDAVSASDRMTQAQYDDCAAHGVGEILELHFGFDGIVLAGTAAGPVYSLTRDQILRALAREVTVNGRLTQNPHRTWSEIDPQLPRQPISVYGPPTERGMRAYIEQRLMGVTAPGSQIMRSDGGWTDQGEVEPLLALLANEPGALAFMSYADMRSFGNILRAVTIDGSPANFQLETASGYPLRRPLYLYVKRGNIQSSRELSQFVAYFLSSQVTGPDGYLAKRGLAPLTSTERARALQVARAPMQRPH
jgi:phosphate transport system substrate-binding protein